MASTIHQSRSSTNTKSFKTSSSVPVSSRYTHTASSQIKGSSKPSSPPRSHYGNQLYSNQTKSSSNNSIVSSSGRKYSSSSINTNLGPSSSTTTTATTTTATTSSYMIPYQASMSAAAGIASIPKHGHSLSASSSTISYPHPSTHPPLRLLTTATCLETLTCLVSAQSPPHSPTFSAIGVPKSGTSGTGSRASSILDGILGATLGSSSPPTSSGTMKNSSSYSAAKEILSDFSIPPSKRSNSVSSYASGNNKNESDFNMNGGVIRSRSNYVSFPNFDDIDFVDVTMVEDREEDDDEDQADWYGPDSPPEGQRHSVMEEKLSNSSRHIDSRMNMNMNMNMSMGMPTAPSQHWLLQLENFHELHVNGVQV
ncbi:hypothetical protein BGZ76_001051 [Entomortierella beljakovae]|nr:hypothetical protein BGZ76_001051 [Entomortierella beljakovae]